MTASLSGIYRHPIKSLGRERVERADLASGGWLPGDRLWAVAHERAKLPEDRWALCANFLRCTHGPGLMATTADLDEAFRTVVLDHPVAGRLELAPDKVDAFPTLQGWLSSVWPQALPAPTGIYRYRGGSLTDNPNPWLSVHNMASHRAIEDRVGRTLSIHRWRGNIWLDGLAPWQEFEWIGREIRIGSVTLRVEERIGRCKATDANPSTGERDIDMLGVLRTWGHQDFGVFAEVIGDGAIVTGDRVSVPA